MSDTRCPNDSGITIRDALESDIPAIQHIARRTWADTYRGTIPEEAQAAVLNRAYSHESLVVSLTRSRAFLVAQVDEAPQGISHLGKPSVAGYIDLEFDGQKMDLHRLYVLPEYQRLGLGRRMLEAAVRKALDAVSSDLSYPLVAHVERDNPKARAFYKRMGFVEDDEEIVVIGGVSLPVVRISMTVGGGGNAR